MTFKDDYTLAYRQQQSKEAIERFYPNKVPVVLQPYKNEKSLASLKRRKYLIPYDMKISALMLIIRKRLVNDLNPSIAIFLSTANGFLLSNTEQVSNVYQEHVDKEDNFLYLFYCSENTFG